MTIVPVVSLDQILSTPALVRDILQKQDLRQVDMSIPVKDQAEEFKDGDYFLSFGGGILIWGQVQNASPKRPTAEELESYDSDYREELSAEYEYESQMHLSLIENGYLFGTCYSVACPEGEMGSTHVLLVTAKIDKQMFDRAKANGWRELTPTN